MRPPAGLCRGAAALLAGLAPVAAGEGATGSVATALIVVGGRLAICRRCAVQAPDGGDRRALEDPGVLAAITGNAGGILFAMVTWADKATLPVPWRRIASKADAAAAAAAVRATPRQAGEFTCIGQMFRTVASSVVPAMPMAADRIVVDVSGDGIDNCTDPDAMEAEHKDLIALGVTIKRSADPRAGENDVVGRAPIVRRATPPPDAAAAGADDAGGMVPCPRGRRAGLVPARRRRIRRFLPGHAAENS